MNLTSNMTSASLGIPYLNPNELIFMAKFDAPLPPNIILSSSAFSSGTLRLVVSSIRSAFLADISQPVVLLLDDIKACRRSGERMISPDLVVSSYDLLGRASIYRTVSSMSLLPELIYGQRQLIEKAPPVLRSVTKGDFSI